MSLQDDDFELDERLADWVDGRLTPEQSAELEAEFAVDDQLRQRAEAYRDSVAWTRETLVEDSVRHDRPPQNFVMSVMAELDVAPAGRRWLPLLLSAAAAAALLLTYVVVDQLGGRTPDSRLVATSAAREQSEAPPPADGGAVGARDDFDARARAESAVTATEEVTSRARRAGKDAVAPTETAREDLERLLEKAKEVATQMRPPATEAGRAGVEQRLADVRQQQAAEPDAEAGLDHLRSYFSRYRVPAEPAGQTWSSGLGLPVVTVRLPAAALVAAVEETKKVDGSVAAPGDPFVASVRRLSDEASRVGLPFLVQQAQGNVLSPTVQPLTGAESFFKDGGVSQNAAPAGERWFVVQGDAAQLEDYVRAIRASVEAQGGTLDIEERQPLALGGFAAIQADKADPSKTATVDAPKSEAGQLSLYVVVRPQAPAAAGGGQRADDESANKKK